VPHAVLFPYARTGFYSCLKALNLPTASEVLLTPITIGPMLEVIKALGHQPVFVDLELDTFGVDLNDLADKLRRKPACFLLTYLFGYVPEIAEIAGACRQSGTILLEDFSHNIGAEYDGRPLGTYGSAGIHSASLLKYVDGYNGAFVITRDPKLAAGLRHESERLHEPNPRRIAGIVRRTFIWNFALSRYPFNLLTYPALRCLKTISKPRFEKLLGPSIALRLNSSLPDFYFEDITRLQCRTILRHLNQLTATLASRRRAAELAINAYHEVVGHSPRLPGAPQAKPERQHTYWQFPIPVQDVQAARDLLFSAGVETGSTNLMDLAHASGFELPRTRSVKEKHLFIPLHSHLRQADYRKIFQTLRMGGQI